MYDVCVDTFFVTAPVLTVATIATTSISISWTFVGSEGVIYVVMWETDDVGGCSGGSHMNSVTINDGSTSYEIMGLAENSNYSITVTASNSSGPGSSAVVSAVTMVTGE